MEEKDLGYGRPEESSPEPAGSGAAGVVDSKRNGSAPPPEKEKPAQTPEIAVTAQEPAKEQRTSTLPYSVVGFGGAAGGLQAFKEVLESLDPDTGAAFVLVTHLAHDQEFASSMVEAVPMPIVVLNQDCTIRTANTAFRRLTEINAKELKTRSLPDLVKLLWGIEGIGEKLDNLLRAPTGTLLEFEHDSTTSQPKTLLIKAQALSTDGARVFLLMMEDITLRREAELMLARQKEVLEHEVEIAARELNRTQEKLRGLTAHLFTAQEEERQRIARELHDDISQRLSLLEIVLGEIKGTGTDEEMEQLRSAREQAETLNTDVRLMSHRLHPAILQDLGLSAALKAMVEEFGRREKMPVTYLTQNLPESWSPQAATAIYRIAQEALRNVSKHAGKTHVKAVLAGVNGHLQFRVMDFGVGFDREAENPIPGLGLISMQERARLVGGTFDVQSGLGNGTTVTVDIPLEQNA